MGCYAATGCKTLGRECLKTFLAASAGQTPEDVVWLAQVKNMKAKQSDLMVIQFVKDFQQFYELIGLGELRERARKARFPEELLGLALAGYTTERRICVDDLVSRGVVVESGVVAGDSLATPLVKAY